MTGKTALRLAQLLLLLAVTGVVAFGRRSPSAALVPARISAGSVSDDETEFVLRREPSRHALPYTRKLVEVPAWSETQFGRSPSPSATPLPSQVASAQIPNHLRVRRHRIVEGDTIRSISHEYLGDANRYMEIVSANRHILTHAGVLPLGKYLIIPPEASAARTQFPTVPSDQIPGYLQESPRPLLPVPSS